MKSIKIALILISVFFTFSLFAQEPDTLDSYYDYELIPTSILNGIDTIYHVYFIIDTSEIKKFKRIEVRAGDKEKILSVKPEEITTDLRFKLHGSGYKIDMGEWSGSLNWTVKGKRSDESEKVLMNKKEKDKVNHKVISSPIPMRKIVKKHEKKVK